MIYLDSSALLKQYYNEPGSETIRQIFQEVRRIATASFSYAEVFSALNRKRREKAIDNHRYRLAARAFEEDWRHLVAVPISDEVLARARTLLERYPLRAGDALQLASALLCAEATDVEFASADQRLTQAASAEGFSLLL